MKALTVQQPWAWAIVSGGKRIENRSWRTNHRGPVLIHAGLQVDRVAENRTLTMRRAVDGPDAHLPRGFIIGVAYLTDVHHGGLEPVLCSPWAWMDVWHWVLSYARPLHEPIPVKGRLGLWTPPADVLALVEADGRG